ncbi:hypothetical protein MSZK_08720 [Mycobacterium sp. shizuoka-1]|nr:hypothetical protein MSZK_08720 [Mycobacterium sp. shizuoka-1]
MVGESKAPLSAACYAWLIAGLIALGLGVALLGGAAVAAADTGSASSAGGTTSSSSGTASAKHGVAGSRRAPAANKRGPARIDSTTTRGAGANPRLTPVDSLLRQLRYVFANKAPTIDQGSQTESAGGVVDGTVIAKSNNGFTLKYRLGYQPSYGTVVVDESTGAYKYTPKDEVPKGAIVDEFTIVADNGSNARLPGPAGALQTLLRSIAVRLGTSGPTTADTTIYVGVDSPDLPTIIGNPTVNKQYWVSQGTQTSGLAAVVMVVGQLTGTMPALQDWIDRAKTTDSVQRQIFINNQPTGKARKMYLDNGTDWVWTADALELLSTSGQGITVSTTYLPRTKGDAALVNMAAALENGSAVMVTINSAIMSSTNPVAHAAVVLGINTETDQVYLNDAALGPNGQNATMSLTDFMAAWDPNYPLIIATRPLTSVADQPLAAADLALAA